MDERLFATKELHPQKLKDYKPDWYKNIPKVELQAYEFEYQNKIKNVKACPSFMDIYDNSYVLLAPTDYLIQVNELGVVNWSVPISFYEVTNKDDIGWHHHDQMANFVDKKSNIKAVFKFHLPYKIFTPKGYSVRFHKIPFSYNDQWEACDGILRTDKIHHLSTQTLVKTNEEIFIKQGTPLVCVTPFKRETMKHETVFLPKEKKLKAKLAKNQLRVYGGFHPNYRKAYYETSTSKD